MKNIVYFNHQFMPYKKIDIANSELHLGTTQRKVMASELSNTDEIFLTGTGAEVTPITNLNQHKVANGKIGAVTAQLQKLYFDIVNGINPKHSHWLTSIS